MWICAFLWFGFRTQRYLFARCTWRAFLLSTRLLTATDIVYSRNIVFPVSSFIIYIYIYTYHHHTPYYYMMMRPLLFQTSDGSETVLWLFKYVCILMKSNNKTGTPECWKQGEFTTAALRVIYTSTHHSITEIPSRCKYEYI